MHKAECLEVLLSSSRFVEKSFEYTFVMPWLQTGLLTSSGKKWQARRRLITPTFHFDILKAYLPIMNEQTDILIELLRKKSELNEEIDTFQLMSSTTLDIICGIYEKSLKIKLFNNLLMIQKETAMGISLNSQKNPDNEYVKAVSE